MMSLIKLSSSKSKIAVFLFFLGFLITGLAIAKDYGSHWDEFNSHDFGVRWYQYASNVITNGGPLVPQGKETLHDFVHGPAIEMSFAFLADKLFDFKDSREIILLRHYGTWLLFYISVIFLYLLCRCHFNNEMLALLGCLFLVLHPRIFANSFYDSFDIALLSFYTISMYTLVRYQKTKSLNMAVVHAFTCAILVDIRLIGVMMPFISYILFLWDLVENRQDRRKTWQTIRNTSVYTIALVSFVILFWPYLWRDPFSGMMEIIRLTPRIFFGSTVLYFGEYVKAVQLPWHYIPVWIGITTPILYSLFFIAGCLAIFRVLMKKTLWSYNRTKNDFLFIAAFLFPVLLVIIFHSTLYDSWRHLFFIYPAFVLIALTGVEGCFKLMAKYCHDKTHGAFKAVLTFSIATSFVFTGTFMMRHHPYQNVYFNCLAGENMKEVKEKFDLDYWGLSYRQGLEYITENDKSENIKVYDAVSFEVLANNIKILSVTDRRRISQVMSPDEAKYIITNYRWHKQDYPYPNEFFSINVGNAKILSVFRLKD